MMPFEGGIDSSPNATLLFSVAAAVIYGLILDAHPTLARSAAKTIAVGMLAVLAFILGGHWLLVAALALSAIGDAFLSRDGEPAFRAMERAFVEGGHPATRTVVSCGGGLIVQPGMLDAVKARGVVVCLHASIETILARTERNRNRPLLAVENPEARVRALYAERSIAMLMDAQPLVGRPPRPSTNSPARFCRAGRRTCSRASSWSSRAATSASAAPWPCCRPPMR